MWTMSLEFSLLCSVDPLSVILLFLLCTDFSVRRALCPDLIRVALLFALGRACMMKWFVPLLPLTADPNTLCCSWIRASSLADDADNPNFSTSPGPARHVYVFPPFQPSCVLCFPPAWFSLLGQLACNLRREHSSSIYSPILRGIPFSLLLDDKKLLLWITTCSVTPKVRGSGTPVGVSSCGSGFSDELISFFSACVLPRRFCDTMEIFARSRFPIFPRTISLLLFPAPVFCSFPG